MALDFDVFMFKTMFKEELRLHKSFVGGTGSAFFPFMIFLFSVVLAVTSPVVLKNIDVPTILMILHVAALMYGLSVGALGHIGEEVMTRRLGQVNMLLQLPQIHPISFKKIMALFYLKDAVFYIFYSILPLVGGIAIGAILVKAPMASVALLGLTVFLTFMFGMSLSFLLSALSIRSKPATGAAVLMLLLLVLLAWPFKLIPLGYIILPLGFWTAKEPAYLLASTLLVIVLSVAAVSAMRERFDIKQGSFKSVLLETEKRFSFSGGLSLLVAKEWLELRRSGSFGAVFTGFLGPLFAIYIIVWIFRNGMGLPLSFNVLFYGGMVGFFGVMTYSWITNLEPNEFMNVQPATVDEVIRAKLVLFFLLTSFVSFGYVMVIGYLNGELALLPLALLITGSTTVYVILVTARLTGIWTNTMLFDPKVLAKFFAAVVPPLILVMVMSFIIGTVPLVATAFLVALSFAMLGASKFIWDSTIQRWKGEHFAFATIQAGSQKTA